jgi:hypothetical protein
MFTCALALAGHGRPDCLQPFTALARPALAPDRAPADPTLLITGVLFHEGVAILLGILGMGVLAPTAGAPRLALWIGGGALSMLLTDRAVLAWRAPAMPRMLGGVETVPYVIFGLTLAGVALWWPGIHEPARFVLAPGPAGAVVLDRPVFEVVVAPHCFGCERALGLVAEVQQRFPGLVVRVVELKESSPPRPGVVAVPTYLLGGKVLFIGNPTLEALQRALTQAGLVGDHQGPERS